MKKEVLLPKLGESLVSAKIVRWLKKSGETISKDEPLVEVMTDKVASEIPSPFAGTLEECFAKIDEEIEVGKPLCTITESCAKHSPAVKTLLKKHSLKEHEVPRKNNERLSRKDIESFLQNPQTIDRTVLAHNLMRAHQTIPQGTLSTRIDITQMYRWRLEHKQSFLDREGVPLTFTSLLMHAVANTLKAHPLIYSFWDDQAVTPEKIDLGLAVDRPEGADVETIVQSQTETLSSIAQQLAKIKKGAQPKHTPRFTLTNIGMSGIEQGFPIVPLHQTSILAVGAPIDELRPHDQGFSVRKLAWFTLAFDHRVYDGMYGCRFLKDLKQYLENHEIAL